MATIRQLPSGHWQVQIRLKGRQARETFLRHDHAREWASSAEAPVDKGRSPSGRRARSAKTLGALIDLHIDDMMDVGKPPQRSKSATLEMLQFSNMKELRFRAAGGVWRVAFAFDPSREGILLVAGDKSGGSEGKFYRRLIAKADERYAGHLEAMKKPPAKKG